MQLRESGVLTGRITKGPLSPVIEPNVVYVPAPVADVKIMVTSLNSKEVVSIVSDGQGYFNVSLPPGTYQVTLGVLANGYFSKDVPDTIAIQPSAETRMDLHLDTGIR